MKIDLQEETESKDVIHSLKVMRMLSQSENLNKNKFIIMSLDKTNLYSFSYVFM